MMEIFNLSLFYLSAVLLYVLAFYLVIHLSDYIHIINTIIIESKTIPVIRHGGLEGCEMLRIPECLDSVLTDGSKVISLTHRPLRYSPETLFLSFW
jgi:hypothetical protein